jgi:branched-subunit amino acid ABC-type transport system permease component
VSTLPINLQIRSLDGVGAVYSLGAPGFVFIIRTTKVVSFDQGDITMLSAFATYRLLTLAGLSYWASLESGDAGVV